MAVMWLTCCHDEARCRLFRQNRDPTQLNIQQLTPPLGQVQGTAIVQLRDGEGERERNSEYGNAKKIKIKKRAQTAHHKH